MIAHGNHVEICCNAAAAWALDTAILLQLELYAIRPQPEFYTRQQIKTIPLSQVYTRRRHQTPIAIIVHYLYAIRTPPKLRTLTTPRMAKTRDDLTRLCCTHHTITHELMDTEPIVVLGDPRLPYHGRLLMDCRWTDWQGTGRTHCIQNKTPNQHSNIVVGYQINQTKKWPTLKF